MTDRQFRDARREFVNGERDVLRFGGYGGTVTVKIVPDGVMIETTKPKRRQRKLTPNARAVRETAVKAAEVTLERIRGVRSKRQVVVSPPKAAQAGLLTPRNVWLSYLRLRLGEIPEDEILEWGRKDVVAFLRRLSASARQDAPSADYIYSVILAARRLDEDGAVPLDGDFEDIQPGDLDAWVTKKLRCGASPHTAKTYRGRFQAAVRTCMEKWPHQWARRIDPTRGTKVIRTEHIKPDELGEERTARLFATLRARGAWRALATGMIADATARRVASIAGEREGVHLDAPPLCAKDFRRARDGSLEVVWRAEAQKGWAFGRGDVVHPATRQLELVYRWLVRYHPNPLGPEHPLVWSAAGPARAESYDRLNAELEAAWRETFGEKKPRGLGWHSICRTTITTLSDEVGTLATADFVGRSVKRVEGTYRRVRRETVHSTARRLDQIRRDRRNMAETRSEVDRG